MRRVRSLKFRSPVVTALVALLMLGFMAPAANANGVIPKPFTMTVSPSTSPAGASAQFTVTVKNWSACRSSGRWICPFRRPTR